MSKAGRPKGSKSTDNPRSKRLMVRLTEDELEEIKDAAYRAGGKVSDYVRGKVLGWRV